MIMWKSKKQKDAVLSTAKAEYTAMVYATCETVWLCNLYKEIKYTQQSPITLYGDNQLAIAIAKNLQYHSQSKHFQI